MPGNVPPQAADLSAHTTHSTAGNSESASSGKPVLEPEARREDVSIWHPTENILLRAAKDLAFARPLTPYPGWRFDIEWDNPDIAFQIRRLIWSYFRDHKSEASIPMKWHHGLELKLWLGNDLSKQLFIAGCYEPNETAFVNCSLKPGMVFVDAGANDGLYTLLASRLVGPSGQVWAFEPSEREFMRLQQNLSLNKISNVRPLRVALADVNGETELAVAEDEHAGQNTLGSFSCAIQSLRKETVSMRRLDDLFSEERLNRLDLIKVDIEGAETRLISGAFKLLRNLRPVVLFEASETALQNTGSSSTQLLDLFRKLGYDIYSFASETGRPIAAKAGEFSGNMIAAPAEAGIVAT